MAKMNNLIEKETKKYYNFEQIRNEIDLNLGSSQNKEKGKLYNCPFCKGKFKLIIYHDNKGFNCPKCNTKGNLLKLADLLNINTNQFINISQSIPKIDDRLLEYWKGRGITFYPLSFAFTENNKVTYYTYKNKERFKFQYSYLTDQKNRKAFKRYNFPNRGIKQQEFLFIPFEWDSYKGKEDKQYNIYLVEGIPDCLTLIQNGFKAIALKDKGSVDNIHSKKTLENLKSFLEYTNAKKLIIIPDPDAYSLWKEKLNNVYENKTEIVDISLWNMEEQKIDSNDLYKSLGFNRENFKEAVIWLRKQCKEYRKGDIIRSFKDKCYYKVITKKTKDKIKTSNVPLSNFIMIYRNHLRDKETKGAKSETTFIYGNKKITKLVDDRIAGDKNKVNDYINDIDKKLFITKKDIDLKKIIALEDDLKQVNKEIESYDKFGVLEENFILFKNLAVIDKTLYKSNEFGHIKAKSKNIKCINDDAVSLNTNTNDDVNKELIKELQYLFGYNGVYALAFNLASIICHKYIKTNKNFPLLYVKGNFGIGKSTLLNEIAKLFGIEKTVDIKQTTIASLHRMGNAYNLLPLVMNEYTPSVDEDKDSSIAGFYDRRIKNKARTDNTNATKDNTFNAICNISSNYIPDIRTHLYRRMTYLIINDNDVKKDYERFSNFQKLVKQSDIVVKTACLDIDIDELIQDSKQNLEDTVKEYKITKPELQEVIRNNFPIFVGLRILLKLGLIETDGAYSIGDYECHRYENITNEIEEVETETLLDQFLKDLAYLNRKEIRTENRDNGRVSITALRPNLHYKITKEKDLYIIPTDCFEVLKEQKMGEKGKGYDHGNIRQAFKTSEYYKGINQPRKFDKDKTVKVWIFKLSEIERKLNISFRKNDDDPILFEEKE